MHSAIITVTPAQVGSVMALASADICTQAHTNTEFKNNSILPTWLLKNCDQMYSLFPNPGNNAAVKGHGYFKVSSLMVCKLF